MFRGIQYMNDTVLQNEIKNNLFLLIEKNKLRSAQSLLQEYEELIPNDIEIYSIRAMVEMKQRNFKSAEKILNMGLEKNPSNYYLLTKLKIVYEKTNRLKKAKKIETHIAFSMGTMRYLRPGLSPKDFFLGLKKDNIKYVVLRWFEELPEVEPGGDLDILVEDDDIVKIAKYFVPYPVKEGVACDVYTISPFPCSSYAGLPYYPKKIARKILNARKIYKDIIFVPSEENYFLSMIYHILYHKAERADLPLNEQSYYDQSKLQQNKYYKILSKFIAEYQLDLRCNFTELHNFMKHKGWSPSIDLTRKLGLVNKSSWLSNLYKPANFDTIKDGELIVVFIREWIYEKNKSNFILKWLEDFGFSILHVEKLDRDQIQRAKDYIRGGNWDEGTIYRTGGPPKLMVVAFDYNPIPLDTKYKKSYPFVVNGNFLKKNILRQEVNALFNSKDITNPIHTTDDEIEAWEYITIINDKLIPKISIEVERRKNNYRTKEKVIGTLKGFKQRAKAEIISYKGSVAVKKTFREGKERFLLKEKIAYEKLSKKCSMIPQILDYGENYIIIPYYEDILKEDSYKAKQILNKHIKQIAGFLKFLFDEGYAHLDFHPGNLIYDKREGLKVIDFEYLYEYRGFKPAEFSLSYDIVGRPKNFNDDYPNYVGKGLINLYNQMWIDKSGFSLEQISKMILE